MAKTVATLKQAKFDPRILSQARPLNSGQPWTMSRGFIIWDQTTATALSYSDRAVISFMYNPSTVAATYQLQQGDAASSVIFANQGDQSDLNIPINQSAQFSIMFDRTFDLWGSYSDTGAPPNGVAGWDPSVIGAQHDVLILQQMCGMLTQYKEAQGGGNAGQDTGSDNSTTTGGAAGGGGGLSNPSLFNGLMQMIPMWVYFGNPKGLWYYGYISEFDVQYTHFTQWMIPMRCVIDINWTMLPPKSSINNKGTPGSTIPTNAYPTDTGGYPSITPPLVSGGSGGAPKPPKLTG